MSLWTIDRRRGDHASPKCGIKTSVTIHCASPLKKTSSFLFQQQPLSYNCYSATVSLAGCFPRRSYIDDTLCAVIGCYGYDVNSAAGAAEGANDKDDVETMAFGRSS